MAFLEGFARSRLIAAHRGVRSERPENTLSAIAASAGRCDFIEVDVQLTRDGVAVIIHDLTLERTSNIADLGAYHSRTPWRVADFDLAELEELDFGSWFIDADPFGLIKQGVVVHSGLVECMPQRILTLDRLLAFACEHDLYLNIELKDLTGTSGHTEIVSTTLRDIRNRDCENRVLLSSFCHDYLAAIKSHSSEMAIAALEEKTVPDNPATYLKRLGVEAYHLEDTLCGASLVSKLNAAGIRVNVFTVNDERRQQELYAMGVTAVFTDFLPNR